MRKLRQIILVDDDALSGYINQLLIGQLDCADSVLLFHHPDEVVAWFDARLKSPGPASFFPELVITDFNMPGMDGLQLIQRLQEMETPSKVHYCILSGSIDKIDPYWLQQNGVLKQLLKPLEKKAFVELMRAFTLSDSVTP